MALVDSSDVLLLHPLMSLSFAFDAMSYLDLLDIQLD